ncbi:MAG: NADH-quinone oxidoreductase subunit J [Dehalococcoidia bacterium]
MLFQDLLFWVVALVIVFSALGVILLHDVFRAVIALVASFLGVAGLFVLLNAEFLGVIQVLIYAGAISIVIIFAIMLTRDVQQGNLPNRLEGLALVFCALLLAAIVFVALNTDWHLLADLPEPTRQAADGVFASTPVWLGRLLVREFVLPLEAVAALLLAAVLGALVLVAERGRR